MLIFIISLCFILIAMLAMAIGLLFGKEGVKGSCNGLSNLVESDHSCGLCSDNCKVTTGQGFNVKH